MIAVNRAMEYWTLVTCLLVWTVLINQCLHTLPHNECSDEIGLLVFLLVFVPHLFNCVEDRSCYMLVFS